MYKSFFPSPFTKVVKAEQSHIYCCHSLTETRLKLMFFLLLIVIGYFLSFFFASWNVARY